MPQDLHPLIRVLPDSKLFDGPATFYLHIAMLFRFHSLLYEEVHFTQLALSLGSPLIEASALWRAVIGGYTDLGMFDDAYAAWAAAPYEEVYVFAYQILPSVLHSSQ